MGPRSVCLLLTFDGLPVACAAIRELESSVAEIKRVYVVPPFRRRGLARWLLAELERHAVESNFQLLRLETGRRQPEALALYEVCEYAQIAPYGRHVGDPMSVCFEKVLIR